MLKEIIEIVNYIDSAGGEVVNIYDGFDGDFSDSDKANLPQEKYVLPYIFFSLKKSGQDDWQNLNEELFNKIGALAKEFNDSSLKEGERIYWKMIIWNWEKEKGLLCVSPTTNRMDLHDPSVVLGLTKEKRMELRATSLELFEDFGEYLKNVK